MLAQSQVEAFEVVVSRPVDALIVSASMRAADDEPFYRVLWRLHPELKSRTVLVTDADLSGPVSNSSRIVNRPLDRAAITRLSEQLLRRA